MNVREWLKRYFVLERDTLHTFEPVRLASIDSRRDIIVSTVEDAARELLTDWPDDDGEKFYEAVKACLDCLYEQGETEVARTAFIQAAWEAGMQVES